MRCRRHAAERQELAASPKRWVIMDRQTKREILILAIGTALLEAPAIAITVLVVLGH
jgi:hypothetical protein